VIDRFRVSRSLRRPLLALAAILVVAPALAACGGNDKQGAQIQWIPGTPPGEVAQNPQPTPTEPPLPTNTATDTESATTAPSPTKEAAPAPTATAQQAAAVTGRKLSAAELERYKPDELGRIPVLEYHVITTDASLEAQFVRTADDFRADLQWLYDHNFYVIPLRDLVEDQIKAPAGKHPVVLTFDDSTAGQFRYLFAADGTPSIDPDSAVGIMEDFYAAHPDFGRGGFFAVLPTENSCFAWQLEDTEEDQIGHCAEKLQWLVANGYEVGNHTLNHTDLYDVTDDKFAVEIGGAIDAIQKMAPDATADILAIPYGDYPKKGHEAQREMLRNGFEYKGREIHMLGALMVGSEPAVSPVSTDWDPLYIYRIQAWDKDAQKKDPKNLGDAASLTDWFDLFASDPDRLYTSDGDPNTITIPDQPPSSIAETFDETKADGKEVVRY
jgi:peptidoglycan/xylan/chitin deacetylase (PgdA/CDA1 family)